MEYRNVLCSLLYMGICFTIIIYMFSLNHTEMFAALQNYSAGLRMYMPRVKLFPTENSPFTVVFVLFVHVKVFVHGH